VDECPCPCMTPTHPTAPPPCPLTPLTADELILHARLPLRQATVVDSRRAMATTVFTADALGLKSTKRCPTTDNMKTVFAPEATHDVARRVRDACRPLRTGAASNPNAGPSHCPFDAPLTVRRCRRRTGEREQLSLEAYSASSQACDMMPQRPVWDYSMSSGRVHYREGKAFMAWLARMRESIMERGGCVASSPLSLSASLIHRTPHPLARPCNTACTTWLLSRSLFRRRGAAERR